MQDKEETFFDTGRSDSLCVFVEHDDVMHDDASFFFALPLKIPTFFVKKILALATKMGSIVRDSSAEELSKLSDHPFLYV
jgi:hypothetical protein